MFDHSRVVAGVEVAPRTSISGGVPVSGTLSAKVDQRTVNALSPNWRSNWLPGLSNSTDELIVAAPDVISPTEPLRSAVLPDRKVWAMSTMPSLTAKPPPTSRARLSRNRGHGALPLPACPPPQSLPSPRRMKKLAPVDTSTPPPRSAVLPAMIPSMTSTSEPSSAQTPPPRLSAMLSTTSAADSPPPSTWTKLLPNAAMPPPEVVAWLAKMPCRKPPARVSTVQLSAKTPPPRAAVFWKIDPRSMISKAGPLPPMQAMPPPSGASLSVISESPEIVTDEPAPRTWMAPPSVADALSRKDTSTSSTSLPSSTCSPPPRSNGLVSTPLTMLRFSSRTLQVEDVAEKTSTTVLPPLPVPSSVDEKSGELALQASKPPITLRFLSTMPMLTPEKVTFTSLISAPDGALLIAVVRLDSVQSTPGPTVMIGVPRSASPAGKAGFGHSAMEARASGKRNRECGEGRYVIALLGGWISSVHPWLRQVADAHARSTRFDTLADRPNRNPPPWPVPI